MTTRNNALPANSEEFANNLSLRFDNTYVRLPEHFYQRIEPDPVESPELIDVNKKLLVELGLSLDQLTGKSLAKVFAGNVLPEGAEPIAMAYAGHQFGNFVPQLGDGRAVLIGEILDKAQKRWDLQLKGSGQTRFSRSGDGRAPLGPVIREYIMSESMNSLGVSTSRTLAIVQTGENVIREKILPGAVLTRMASSHIRVGTFQYYLCRNDVKGLKILADYVINRLYPNVRDADNPYYELFMSVCEAQAVLVANWMLVGFIHGVMNTDNTTISGETIDYGPCAFLDIYDHNTVFSSIDNFGRYAFENQPSITQWNLARLAECLLPIIGLDEKAGIAMLSAGLEEFLDKYNKYWLRGLCGKIGLVDQLKNEDKTLAQNLLDLMEKYQADYTLTFRYLCDCVEVQSNINDLLALFQNNQRARDWVKKWQNRIAQEKISSDAIKEKMKSINPAFIPRNHLVEQAIDSALENKNFSDMFRLLEILDRPFSDQPKYHEYMQPPKPEEKIFQTFCGT